MLTFDRECIADAKKKGLHLVRLEINGRHAKRASMACTVQVGPKTAAKLIEVFNDLCDVKTRME